MTIGGGEYLTCWGDARVGQHLIKRHYTLGPALRIPDIKNMGRDLALEELRICPGFRRP